MYKTAAASATTTLSLHDALPIYRSRRRRRRLLAGQIGGGGSAQHGQGCSRCEYNLHHDYSPCVWTASPSDAPDGATEEGRPLFPSPLSQSGFHRCTV